MVVWFSITKYPTKTLASHVLRELCNHTKSSYDTFNSLIVSELNNLKKEILKRKVSDLGARGDPYDDSSSESEDPQEENDG